MKYTYKGALTSAPKFLTAFMLSIFLVACGGGTSGDGTTSGDTDFELDGGDTDFELDGGDTDFEPDNGFDTGGSDVDSDGNGFTDAQEAQICFGLPGDDEASANFRWNDNCHISAASPFATSTYAQGIQRVLYCSGVGGISSSTAAFADGIFGPNTAEAVRAFQTAENVEGLGAVLAVDGIVGPDTWDRLQSKVSNIDTGASAFINTETNLGVDSEVFGVLATTAIDCSNERNFIGLINDESQLIDGWALTDTPDGFGVNTFSIAKP